MSTTDLDRDGLALVTEARQITVTDDASLMQAGDYLKLVKAYLARVAEVFDPIVTTAHAAHKTAVAQRDAMKRHAVDAELVLKTRMATYQREQENERRRKAEEAERIAREAEESKRLEAAVAAEQRGDAQAAERILATPAPVMVAPQPPAAKVEGVSFGESWRAEVTSLPELVLYVAKHPEHMNLLMSNAPALNAMARAAKNALAIPGVRAVREARVTVRA